LEGLFHIGPPWVSLLHILTQVGLQSSFYPANLRRPVFRYCNYGKLFKEVLTLCPFDHLPSVHAFGIS
jgi:hypothetical protein